MWTPRVENWSSNFHLWQTTPRHTPIVSLQPPKKLTIVVLSNSGMWLQQTHVETTFQHLYGYIPKLVSILKLTCGRQISEDLPRNWDKLHGNELLNQRETYIGWDPLESDMDTTISHLYGSQTQLIYKKLWIYGRYLTYSVNYLRHNLTGPEMLNQSIP